MGDWNFEMAWMGVGKARSVGSDVRGGWWIWVYRSGLETCSRKAIDSRG